MAKFLGPSFDINTNPGGDEGGEIRMATAETNTTLNGPIKIDVYQNKLRFFEGGSPNRGAYIDLSSASNGVGSNLLSGGGGATTLDGLSDVTAPSPASGDFLKWNGTAWVNDAIDLATDTTGNYVSSLVAGTGITLTNNSGEASTPTIAIDTSATLPSGSIQMYGGTSSPTGWFLCDGSEKAISTYGSLYAIIGTNFGSLTNGSGGAGTTHFRLPDMRSRMPIGVGTGTGLSARSIGDTGGVESVTLTAAQSGLVGHGHANTFSASSGNQSADHSHTANHNHSASSTPTDLMHAHSLPRSSISAAGTNRLNVSNSPTDAALATYNSSLNALYHAHTVTVDTASFSTSGVSANHNHAITLSGSVTNASSANASESHDNMSPFLAVNFIIKS